MVNEITVGDIVVEGILNSIMPTLEQGLENHFRRNAPSCARMEWDRSAMTAYVKIPGKEEVAIYTTTASYVFDEDSENEHAHIVGLHHTAEYVGILCLKYLAQMLIDESDHRGKIDCYHERLLGGYQFLGIQTRRIEASIAGQSVLNKVVFEKIVS